MYYGKKLKDGVLTVTHDRTVQENEEKRHSNGICANDANRYLLFFTKALHDNTG